MRHCNYDFQAVAIRSRGVGNFVDNIDNRVLAPAPAADSLFAGTRDKKWNIARCLNTRLRSTASVYILAAG